MMQISPRLLISVADTYNDIKRVFMEYIDNSLDAAEELFNHKTKSYKKNIKITLTVSDKVVSFRDNCTGVSNFDKLIESIGDSDKKSKPWTNGQFGFGIYSFMSYCDLLEIASQIEGDRNSNYVKIPKKEFNKNTLDDVDIKTEVRDKRDEVGVAIRLSDFQKKELKKVNLAEIAKEIQLHFELLLKRKNLIIELVDKRNQQKIVCEAFNYEQYTGESYTNEISNVTTMNRGKEIKQKLESSVLVHLRITKDVQIDRPPVFIIKDRRIMDIKDAKEFKSKHKSDIWGHSNISGYVDLKDLVQPDITRKDFNKTDTLSMIFSALEQLEPVIQARMKEINKASEDTHYSKLQDRLNAQLSKMSKKHNLLYRTTLIQGKGVPALQGETTGTKGGGSHHRHGPSDDPTPVENPGGNYPGSGKGDGANGSGGKGDKSKPRELDNPFDDTEFSASESKKPGFNIVITDQPLMRDLDGNKIRSDLNAGTIRIFREHPDFKSRVKYQRDGDPKVTQRLITYLSGEITVHFLDKFYTKGNTAAPEYSKALFVALVEYVYEFESGIADLDGMHLAELE